MLTSRERFSRSLLRVDPEYQPTVTNKCDEERGGRGIPKPTHHLLIRGELRAFDMEKGNEF